MAFHVLVAVVVLIILVVLIVTDQIDPICLLIFDDLAVTLGLIVDLCLLFFLMIFLPDNDGLL